MPWRLRPDKNFAALDAGEESEATINDGFSMDAADVLDSEIDKDNGVDLDGAKTFIDFYSDSIKLGINQTIEQLNHPYPRPSTHKCETYQAIISDATQVVDPDLDRLYIACKWDLQKLRIRNDQKTRRSSSPSKSSNCHSTSSR